MPLTGVVIGLPSTIVVVSVAASAERNSQPRQRHRDTRAIAVGSKAETLSVSFTASQTNQGKQANYNLLHVSLFLVFSTKLGQTHQLCSIIQP